MQGSILFQGTILDRIDYNLEHAAINIDEGVEELKKVSSFAVTTSSPPPQFLYSPTPTSLSYCVCLANSSFRCL